MAARSRTRRDEADRRLGASVHHLHPDRFLADDFPARVGEVLADAKRAGVAFEDAWAEAMSAVAIEDPGWGSSIRAKGNPGVESPLRFLRRHMRAAYEGSDAARYCRHRDCAELTFDRYCRRHMPEGLAA